MARETTQQSNQQAGRQDAQQSDRQQDQQEQSRQAARQDAQRGDRERAIDATRESGRQGGAGLARRPGYAPVFGRGALADPFSLMQRMAEDMDRLFEGFGLSRGLGLTPAFGSLLGREGRPGGALAGREEQAPWSPQVEMFQRGDKLVVRADLPGISKDALNVDVEDDVLTIRGERREEHEENREGFYRSERSYGSFHRAIPLPDGVDASQCDATYKDGVLEITLPAPRQEERKPRRIQIR